MAGDERPDCRNDMPGRRPDRGPSQANAHAIFADNWLGRGGLAPVPLGAMPGLSHDQLDRPARARSPPPRGNQLPNPIAVLPFVPAKRSVRRTCAPITDQHR